MCTPLLRCLPFVACSEDQSASSAVLRKTQKKRLIGLNNTGNQYGEGNHAKLLDIWNPAEGQTDLCTDMPVRWHESLLWTLPVRCTEARIDAVCASASRFCVQLLASALA